MEVMFLIELQCYCDFLLNKKNREEKLSKSVAQLGEAKGAKCPGCKKPIKKIKQKPYNNNVHQCPNCGEKLSCEWHNGILVTLTLLSKVSEHLCPVCRRIMCKRAVENAKQTGSCRCPRCGAKLKGIYELGDLIIVTPLEEYLSVTARLQSEIE